VKLLSNKRRKL